MSQSVKKQRLLPTDHSSQKQSFDSFSKPSKLIYHHISESSVLCSFPKFTSPACCEDLIALCESEGFHTEERKEYSQATFDLEVDSSPCVREWLINRGLVPNVAACMRSSHAAAPLSFDDVFVVKYDATIPGGQQGLEWHVDAGDVSFMLALSARDCYSGGGTAFDCLQEGYDENEQRLALEGMRTCDLGSYFSGSGSSSGNSIRPLHLEQGELLIFDAKLYHCGLQITSGVRYLLVGFCFTASSSAVGGETGTEQGVDTRRESYNAGAASSGSVSLDLLSIA